MQYRSLGKSGIQASAVAFGGGPIGGGPWGAVDETEAISAIHACIDDGINLFDTAPVYGVGTSEELLGKAIAGRRDKVLIATKCGLVWHVQKGTPFHKMFSGKIVYRYLGPESIRYELDQSLRRLRTDYIDVYQTHWQDSTTPIATTMEVLVSLRQEGKIRAIGVSNCSVEQLETYETVGPIACAQEKYNMIERGIELDLVPFCLRRKIGVLAYTPLASGLLTGKVDAARSIPAGDHRHDHPFFTREAREAVQELFRKLQGVADSYKISYSQLAIAWTIAQPGITHALVGARNVRQGRENAAAGHVVLNEADLRAVEEVLTKKAFAVSRS